MIRRLLFAGIVAAVFTLTLNFDSIRELSAGRLTVAILNDQSADELYYFATIAKVGQGQPPLGHTSYMEHNRDGSIVNLAPVLPGLAMRFLGLSLRTTLFLGDLLFPFLAVFLLTLGFLSAFRSRAIAGAAAVLLAAEIGTYWFRASNPQLPFVAVAAWIAVVMAYPPASRTGLALRGLIIGVLTWLQVVYASLFVIVDGTLLLAGLLEHRKLSQSFKNGLLYGLCLVIPLLPRFFVRPTAESAADTIHRIGLIETHLPALPKLQLLLLCVIAVLAIWLWKTKKKQDEHLRTCIILLIGCLIALNQAVITGVDALFAGYYPHPINLLLTLTLVIVAVQLLSTQHWKNIAFIAVAIVCLANLRADVAEFSAGARGAAVEYEKSDVPQVLAWLKDQPGPVVIASPYGINGRIPYETLHYDLFNGYGWNLPMTDTELAQRYALQVRLIPSSQNPDRTNTHVFGGFAGLTASKRRAYCRLKRSILRTDDPCIIDAASLTIHQELYSYVDDLKIDVKKAMKKFHVSYVVTEQANTLPPEIRDMCTKKITIGTYTIWSCASAARS